jgi:hypothetical protein
MMTGSEIIWMVCVFAIGYLVGVERTTWAVNRELDRKGIPR